MKPVARQIAPPEHPSGGAWAGAAANRRRVDQVANVRLVDVTDQEIHRTVVQRAVGPLKHGPKRGRADDHEADALRGRRHPQEFRRADPRAFVVPIVALRREPNLARIESRQRELAAIPGGRTSSSQFVHLVVPPRGMDADARTRDGASLRVYDHALDRRARVEADVAVRGLARTDVHDRRRSATARRPDTERPAPGRQVAGAPFACGDARAAPVRLTRRARSARVQSFVDWAPRLVPRVSDDRRGGTQRELESRRPRAAVDPERHRHARRRVRTRRDGDERLINRKSEDAGRRGPLERRTPLVLVGVADLHAIVTQHRHAGPFARAAVGCEDRRAQGAVAVALERLRGGAVGSDRDGVDRSRVGAHSCGHGGQQRRGRIRHLRRGRADGVGVRVASSDEPGCGRGDQRDEQEMARVEVHLPARAYGGTGHREVTPPRFAPPPPAVRAVVRSPSSSAWASEVPEFAREAARGRRRSTRCAALPEPRRFGFKESSRLHARS